MQLCAKTFSGGLTNLQIREIQDYRRLDEADFFSALSRFSFPERTICCLRFCFSPCAY